MPGTRFESVTWLLDQRTSPIGRSPSVDIFRLGARYENEKKQRPLNLSVQRHFDPFKIDDKSFVDFRLASVNGVRCVCSWLCADE